MRYPHRPGFCRRCAPTPDPGWVRLCPVHVAAADMLTLLQDVKASYPRLQLRWEKKIDRVLALAEGPA